MKKVAANAKRTSRGAQRVKNDDASRFVTVKETFADLRDTTESRMFGSSALKTNERVFAMLVKGNLVVKLPAERVNSLLETGVGRRFDPGHGRLMKEWIAIDASAGNEWVALAQEARRFVNAR